MFVSVNTGQVVFVSSQYGDQANELPSVADSYSRLTRYFAFHDRYTESDPPEAGPDTAVVGVLQYGPTDGPITRVTIRHTKGRAVDYRLGALKVWLDGVEQERLQVELPNPRKRTTTVAMSDFSIAIHFHNYSDDPDIVILIPVLADHLRLDRATVPAGFTLR